MLGLMGFPNQNEILRHFGLENSHNLYEEMRQNVGCKVRFSICDELDFVMKRKREGVIVKALELDEKYIVKCGHRTFFTVPHDAIELINK